MLEKDSTEFQLGRLRMRIPTGAKAISYRVCVASALLLLTAPAFALPGDRIAPRGSTPHFTVGSEISPGAVSSHEPYDIAPVDGEDRAGRADPGASTIISGYAGPVGDVPWSLFDSGAGDWDRAEASTEIPEPAPLAILGVAILGLGFLRYLRKT